MTVGKLIEKLSIYDSNAECVFGIMEDIDYLGNAKIELWDVEHISTVKKLCKNSHAGLALVGCCGASEVLDKDNTVIIYNYP